MGREKRRHDRFFVRLPVTLIIGKSSFSAETVDVSFGGLFLRTSNPPPLRQLVKLTFPLPPEDESIDLMAMAVFVDKNASPPGAGLKLFGLSPETQLRWEQFVNYVRALPRAKDPPESDLAEPVDTTEDMTPCLASLRPELRVTVRSPEDLLTIRSKEFRQGRIYVRTDRELDPSTQVDVLFEHPKTKETFIVLGEIDKRVNRSGFVGLRVLLPSLGPQRLEDFERFALEEENEDRDFQIFIDEEDLEDEVA